MTVSVNLEPNFKVKSLSNAVTAGVLMPVHVRQAMRHSGKEPEGQE